MIETPSLEQRVAAIEARNVTVSANKAWETSWVRRGLIALLTYALAYLYLGILANDRPPLNALVPVGGFLMSTLTIQAAKSWWIARRLR